MSSPSDSTYTSPSPPRANRWQGPARTWQQLTEEERGLAASLDELRNRDLSVHLYNAFALKRRAKGFNARIDDKENYVDEDADEANGFSPPRNWTAWPIESSSVPRDGEQIGPDDGDDIFTLKRDEVNRPSRGLEELLVATTLRFAKEKFQFRESESERVMDDAEAEHVETHSELDEPGGEDAEDRADSIRAPSEPPSTTTILRPTVSADDERSRELLRPSIRHTLSKLDEVLMALHYARQTCQRYASQSGPDTDVESMSRASSKAPGQSGDDEIPKVKRPKGRPRKHAPISTPTTRESSPVGGEGDDPESWRTTRGKTTRRGRPKKVYEKLEGETQIEYLTRIARTQKKPLPKFAPPLKTELSRSVSPSKSPTKRGNSRLQENHHKRNYGLRDWSEVLGSAALVRFSPDVIARATQRCANLFGESMTMRTMIEGRVSAQAMDRLVEYHPGMIPDLEDLDNETSSESSEDEMSVAASDTAAIKHTNDSSSVNRKPYYCPNTKCPASKSGFKTPADLLKHVKTEHKMTKKQIEELMVDSDDEMDGAVHIDRFLKPISGKRGWRGLDSRERKRGRWVGNGKAKEENDDESEDYDSKDSDSESDSEDELEDEQDQNDEEVGDNVEVEVDADDS
ncbi:RNA polymerase i specific transcription initiation factor protein [Rutstroemia sp. NJR-2017a WRK4]|nr:RNA polymerase i specific transcription initiation factor protein [Rutstroemia sp. NJR-2017a WRK4]PQE11806.1 RNA polymerase i specific transcription initiation factor protein [Rutstroemia sp. NJR-2017a WRK4]